MCIVDVYYQLHLGQRATEIGVVELAHSKLSVAHLKAAVKKARAEELEGVGEGYVRVELPDKTRLTGGDKLDMTTKYKQRDDNEDIIEAHVFNVIATMPQPGALLRAREWLIRLAFFGWPLARTWAWRCLTLIVRFCSFAFTERFTPIFSDRYTVRISRICETFTVICSFAFTEGFTPLIGDR